MQFSFSLFPHSCNLRKTSGCKCHALSWQRLNIFTQFSGRFSVIHACSCNHLLSGLTSNTGALTTSASELRTIATNVCAARWASESQVTPQPSRRSLISHANPFSLCLSPPASYSTWAHMHPHPYRIYSSRRLPSIICWTRIHLRQRRQISMIAKA